MIDATFTITNEADEVVYDATAKINFPELLKLVQRQAGNIAETMKAIQSTFEDMTD